MSTKGMDLVRAERRRQVDEEGWGREHDLAHGAEVLERAAISYAVHGDSKERPSSWPWARQWWKPKDRLRNLVRAGALFQAAGEASDAFVSMRYWGQRDLVIAEIDRLTTSDEPARCPHGRTEAHEHVEPMPDHPTNVNLHVTRSPGPAASGTPETTR